MKLVAVSQRVDAIPDRQENRDALDQRLALFIAAAGGLAVPVPNSLAAADLDAWLTTVRPSVVVLSGGNDIGQCRERDRTESHLLVFARTLGIPVLGICRGMQMMAHWAGGQLKRVEGHVRTRHVLRGEITGTVNSFHGFTLAACPEEFVVLARSEDDAIEAVRHKTLPWEGWMWHPEREAEFAERDVQRLKNMLRA